MSVQRFLTIIEAHGISFAVVLSGVNFSQERDLIAPTLDEIRSDVGAEPIAIIGEEPLLRWFPIRATLESHPTQASLLQEFMSIAAWISGRGLPKHRIENFILTTKRQSGDGQTEIINLNQMPEENNCIKENTSRDISLTALWSRCTVENLPLQKGELLEELCAAMFSLIPGFEIRKRVRTETEEIDLVIRNRSSDPFWEKLGAFFLVECKNTKKPTDKNDLIIFSQKLKNRHGSCSLGFLVSMGGFSNTVHKEQLRFNPQDALIVLIGPRQLHDLVEADNLSLALMDVYQKRVFR